MGKALMHVERWTEERTDRQTDRQTEGHDEVNRLFSRSCDTFLKSITPSLMVF